MNPPPLVKRPILPPGYEATNKFRNTAKSVTNTVMEVKTMSDIVIQDGKYEFPSVHEFYAVIKANPELQDDPDVKTLVEFMISVEKACGCSRGALYERAQDMFARMLPIIQARDSNYFDKLKRILNATEIHFKEKDKIIFSI